jgi:histidine triad (HIT) family protein
MASLFSRIIRGEIPSHKVYEDEHTFAFLDINPIARGHALLVPKVEAVTLADLDPVHAAALGRALPRVARAVQKATGCPAYNVLQNNGAQAGQVVMHAHFHIIPRYEHDRLGAGLSLIWRPQPIDHADAAALAGQIAALAAK